MVRAPDGATESLTLVGIVSPAGGNFEEPVTQATLATVKTFLGLSAQRAYKRFYPAIAPLLSWSRYREQLEGWFSENLGPDWVKDIKALQELLQKGDAVEQMMQVTGEEGITIEDFVTLQKALLVDMVYLQQDAFDKVDSSMPRERQLESFVASGREGFASGFVARVRRYELLEGEPLEVWHGDAATTLEVCQPVTR